MNALVIFIWIYVAMIAMSFWESEVEGRYAWDRRKLGWIVRFGKFCLPAYHFFVFFVMWPTLLSLPLVIYGWNFKLFGILVSAYATGLSIEDFLWYIVNPSIKFKDSFNPQFAYYYPWIGIGKHKIPFPYIVSMLVATASWFFIWK